MSYTGYHFFIGDLEMPYAPSELKVVIGSNNKTVDLINGSPINILKNPKLTEIQFDVELPRGRQYAFANKLISSKTYTDYFEKLMLEKTPTQLVITRPNPKANRSQVRNRQTVVGGTNKDFESTVLKVSLEGYDMKESAENAYDVTVSLKFKEYVTYGTVVQKDKKSTVQPVTKPAPTTKSYVVKKGDCLWNISRKFYGTGAKWKTIYNANKAVIENTARRYGKKSSSNGHWIYPGTRLIIPSVK